MLLPRPAFAAPATLATTPATSPAIADGFGSRQRFHTVRREGVRETFPRSPPPTHAGSSGTQRRNPRMPPNAVPPSGVRLLKDRRSSEAPGRPGKCAIRFSSHLCRGHQRPQLLTHLLHCAEDAILG